MWLTTGDEKKKLSQELPLTGSSESLGGFQIDVDPSERDQQMEGFGAALSNSVAYLLYTSPQRDEILASLFDPVEGIGASAVRMVMGASDFNAVEPYTYDDIETGEDFEMEFFSIDKDRDFMLPLMQLVSERYPDVLLMASPWSPPAWMKNPRSLNGGQLRPGEQFLAALADYFVLFLQVPTKKLIN